jgi:hypothetical protein
MPDDPNKTPNWPIYVALYCVVILATALFGFVRWCFQK